MLMSQTAVEPVSMSDLTLLCWTVYKHQKYVMILICHCGMAGMSMRDSCSIEPFVQGHGCMGLQTATVNLKPGTVILVVWTSMGLGTVPEASEKLCCCW